VYRRRYESHSSKPKLHLKKSKIWRKTIFNMADGIITPCNVARSLHWFHQMTAPCNVACGSGIMTLNSPSGSTLQCDTWLWDDMPLNSPVAAPCNVTRSFEIMTLNSPGGSTLQCGAVWWHAMEFKQTSAILEFYIWCRFWPYQSPQSTCHSAPVCEILSKSDHPQLKKMTSCRFPKWRISAILDFRGPIMGSLNSPCTTSYRSIDSSKLLSFWQNRVFVFWWQTNRQTNRWAAPMH